MEDDIEKIKKAQEEFRTLLANSGKEVVVTYLNKVKQNRTTHTTQGKRCIFIGMIDDKTISFGPKLDKQGRQVDYTLVPIAAGKDEKRLKYKKAHKLMWFDFFFHPSFRRCIQKIETIEGKVLYQNDTIDFYLDEDEEKNRNLLYERKFGTSKFNTNYAKFKKNLLSKG